MAALSEVRLWRPGQGQILGVGGNTNFWSGPVRMHTNGVAGHCQHGLAPSGGGKHSLYQRQADEPTVEALNRRLDRGHSLYLHKCRDEGDKDRFYQQLEYVFEVCPAGENPLVLGTSMLYLAHCERATRV